jgi:uncharacterized membrane protein HdeD (DUF308 family)
MPDILHGWTTTGLRGLAALVLGVGALLFGVVPVINLVVLFGAYALIDGALALAAAYAGTGGPALKGFLIGEGFVGIGAGLLAFALYPLWSIALFLLVAAWVVATGVLRVGEAVWGHHDWRSGLHLLTGLTSLPVGYLLFAVRARNAPTLMGAYLLGHGVILLVVAAHSAHSTSSRSEYGRAD